MKPEIDDEDPRGLNAATGIVNATIIMIAACSLSALAVVSHRYICKGDTTKVVDYKSRHHEEVLREIRELESSGGKNLYGRDGEFGDFQFKKSTFNWMKKLAKMPWLEWKDQRDQVTLADWAIRNGYESHWSTYKRAEQNVVMRRYKSE